MRSVSIKSTDASIKNKLIKMEETKNTEQTATNISTVSPTVFPCKKIRAGKYEYRGWIISSVGYYEPEGRVCWEAVDPKTNYGDFHGFSKKQIKWLIDNYMSLSRCCCK